MNHCYLKLSKIWVKAVLLVEVILVKIALKLYHYIITTSLVKYIYYLDFTYPQ